MARALAAAGIAHEQRVLRRLIREMGIAQEDCVSIPRNHPKRDDMTRRALIEGRPLIHQPALSDGSLISGYADILINNLHNPFAERRIRCPGYSVIEVKLASLVTPDYAVQAAAYHDLLHSISRESGLHAPGPAYLWLGTARADPVPLPRDDVEYMYASVRDAYFRFLRAFDAGAPLPPIDAPLAELAPWTEFTKSYLRKSDSLLQVAGIRRSQVSALQGAGVTTMTQLASRQVPSDCKISRATLRTLQEQAQLQVERVDSEASLAEGASTGTCTPSSPIPYRLKEVPYSAPMGLHRLPPPSQFDIYFDMEGFPLVEKGLEYLFGATDHEGLNFRSWWAHDRTMEEQSFISFIDFVWKTREDRQKSQNMASAQPYVYHYGHYEVSALRRLGNRASTPAGVEANTRLDVLLDEHAFVDIYAIVRAALLVGESSYSIKTIEKLVDVSRDGDELADAQSSVALYYEWRRRNLPEPDDEADLADQLPIHRGQEESYVDSDLGDHLRMIEQYNEQDCKSLSEVVEWLRAIAAEADIQYHPRLIATDSSTATDAADPGEPSQCLARGACGRSHAHKLLDSQVIRECETQSISMLSSKESAQAREPSGDSVMPAQARMAHLLGFHVREADPARARFSSRVEYASQGDLQSLVQDDHCVATAELMHLASNSETDEDTENTDEDVSGAQPRSRRRRRPKAVAVFRRDPAEPCARLREGSGCAIVKVAGPSDSEEGSTINAVVAFGRVGLLSPDRVEVEVSPRSSDANGGAGLGLDIPGQVTLISTEDLAICAAPLRASLLESSKRMAETTDSSPNEDTNKPQDTRAHCLVTNFLQRRGYAACDRHVRTVTKENVVDIVAGLEKATLAIQGPPGTGKSTLAAATIARLITEYGMTVAISSNAHAAIDSLLARAVASGVPVGSVVKIGATSPVLQDAGIRVVSNFDRAGVTKRVGNGTVAHEEPEHGEQNNEKTKKRSRLRSAGRGRTTKTQEARLVGGTAYALSKESAKAGVECLFVDEAGQVSLANLTAMAPVASRSIVVLGDQQQLEMPLQGLHVDAVNVGCLSHFVGRDTSVVSPELGLFLNTSYRMAPELCRFVSEAMYDGRLQPAEATERHCLEIKPISDFAKSGACDGNGDVNENAGQSLLKKACGLLFVDRSQFGADSGICEAERDAVARLAVSDRVCATELLAVKAVYDEAVGCGYWAKGERGVLSTHDILVVAPYNAQVEALRALLPAGARVGTVDKFQGQEAPVVIVSTCAWPDGEAGGAGVGETDAGGDLDRSDREYSEDGDSRLSGGVLADERGMRFALRLNRMNVAISRAQCLAVVVGPNRQEARLRCRSLEDASVLAAYDRLVAQGVDCA